jgi:hypothetical protein
LMPPASPWFAHSIVHTEIQCSRNLNNVFRQQLRLILHRNLA